MFKQLTKLTLRVIATVNFVVILLMLFTGYAGYLHPDSYPVLSNSGLIFPVFAVINLAFIVFWVIVKFRYVLLPLLGFIACYGPMNTYCPVSRLQQAEGLSTKVLTYNVLGFAKDADGDNLAIPRYIVEQNADIVCLQEAGRQQNVLDYLSAHYHHCDTAARGSSGPTLAIYSKYPIIKHEHICHGENGNVAAAFHLRMRDEVVIVINTHLETTHLSPTDRTDFQSMVHRQMERDSARASSRRLINTLAESAQKRAPQAETIAEFIEQHAGTPIILCGDFNDSPLSYTHHTIASKLTDCYAAVGMGPGFTYHDNAMYVRIDNILCSEHFAPKSCYTDHHIAVSDHYPVICYMEKQSNTP